MTTSYEDYIERSNFETNGNLSLFLDPSLQDFYVKIRGEKVFLQSPNADLDERLAKMKLGINWLHEDLQDIFAAEYDGDTIKIITRSRLDTNNASKEYKINSLYHFIYTYSKEGKYIDTELNHSGKTHFRSQTDANDKARVRKLAGNSVFSELEMWAINDTNLLNEYHVTGGGGSINYGRPNTNGRLEKWAYYKYQELYPDQPMLEGFGVREEKKTNDHNSFNQDRIYAPKRFNKRSADKITNFNPSTDTLEIDTDSFGIGSSATFASGKNKKAVKKKLAKQDFDFLYDQKKGGLYFNENGADKGFGDGGIIAILKGAPDLTSDNLEFV